MFSLFDLGKPFYVFSYKRQAISVNIIISPTFISYIIITHCTMFTQTTINNNNKLVFYIITTQCTMFTQTTKTKKNYKDRPRIIIINNYNILCLHTHNLHHHSNKYFTKQTSILFYYKKIILS